MIAMLFKTFGSLLDTKEAHGSNPEDISNEVNRVDLHHTRIFSDDDPGLSGPCSSRMAQWFEALTYYFVSKENGCPLSCLHNRFIVPHFRRIMA